MRIWLEGNLASSLKNFQCLLDTKEEWIYYKTFIRTLLSHDMDIFMSQLHAYIHLMKQHTYIYIFDGYNNGGGGFWTLNVSVGKLGSASWTTRLLGPYVHMHKHACIHTYNETTNKALATKWATTKCWCHNDF